MVAHDGAILTGVIRLDAMVVLRMAAVLLGGMRLKVVHWHHISLRALHALALRPGLWTEHVVGIHEGRVGKLPVDCEVGRCEALDAVGSPAKLPGDIGSVIFFNWRLRERETICHLQKAQRTVGYEVVRQLGIEDSVESERQTRLVVIGQMLSE
jgi:hypothetical protein